MNNENSTNRTDTSGVDRVDLAEVAARHAAATMPSVADAVVTAALVDAALADVPGLLAEVAALRQVARRARMRTADLAAAARATLAAFADGDADPLWYLRDELRAQGRLRG